MEKVTNTHRDLWIGLLLALVTLAVYWQVRDHEFTSYDDSQYITKNVMIQSGITFESIKWAFSTGYAANWHPLTWISHMLDYQLFGPDPPGHHLMNIFFHAANTFLLFIVFKQMTRCVWESALVAIVFALHPLHVESAAWTAERKDVLSTLFWILTMGAYVQYVNRPNLNKYFLVILFFALGLMAKPMLVTLPFVLLLLDYWPLGRMNIGKKMDTSRKKKSQTASSTKGSRLLPLVVEKIPLFLLSAISSIVTVVVQKSGGAIVPIENVSLGVRVANAIVSYINYLAKTFWPSDLAVIYPYPEQMLPLWQIIGGALVLMLISGFALLWSRKRPYFALGWFWYLGTLVPVLGLVQVGRASMADRYMYVPLIGIAIMIAWGVSDLKGIWNNRLISRPVVAGILVLALAVPTWAQIGYWQNDTRLFEHSINVTTDNYVALTGLGVAMHRQGNIDKAISLYRKSLRINDTYETGHYNLGLALASEGKIDEAITHFSKAVQINPYYAEAHDDLANALAVQGRFAEAVFHYSEALRINPNFPMAYYNLGLVYAQQQKFDLAIAQFSNALQLKHDYIDAQNALQETIQLRQEREKK